MYFHLRISHTISAICEYFGNIICMWECVVPLSGTSEPLLALQLWDCGQCEHAPCPSAVQQLAAETLLVCCLHVIAQATQQESQLTPWRQWWAWTRWRGLLGLGGHSSVSISSTYFLLIIIHNLIYHDHLPSQHLTPCYFTASNNLLLFHYHWSLPSTPISLPSLLLLQSHGTPLEPAAEPSLLWPCPCTCPCLTAPPIAQLEQHLCHLTPCKYFLHLCQRGSAYSFTCSDSLEGLVHTHRAIWSLLPKARLLPPHPASATLAKVAHTPFVPHPWTIMKNIRCTLYP